MHNTVLKSHPSPCGSICARNSLLPQIIKSYFWGANRSYIQFLPQINQSPLKSSYNFLLFLLSSIRRLFMNKISLPGIICRLSVFITCLYPLVLWLERFFSLSHAHNVSCVHEKTALATIPPPFFFSRQNKAILVFSYNTVLPLCLRFLVDSLWMALLHITLLTCAILPLELPSLISCSSSHWARGTQRLLKNS